MFIDSELTPPYIRFRKFETKRRSKSVNTNFNASSEQDILRLAERERGLAIAGFFRNLFTKRDEQATGFTGGVVAAE